MAIGRQKKKKEKKRSWLRLLWNECLVVGEVIIGEVILATKHWKQWYVWVLKAQEPPSGLSLIQIAKKTVQSRQERNREEQSTFNSKSGTKQTVTSNTCRTFLKKIAKFIENDSDNTHEQQYLWLASVRLDLGFRN